MDRPSPPQGGRRAFFGTIDVDHGRELWMTDGDSNRGPAWTRGCAREPGRAAGTSVGGRCGACRPRLARVPEPQGLQPLSLAVAAAIVERMVERRDCANRKARSRRDVADCSRRRSSWLPP